MSSSRVLTADFVSGISTVPNYIKNGHSEMGSQGFVLFNQASLTTGSGGSPTATLTLTSSNPLRGSQSLLFTPGSAGDGFAYDFTIDQADQGKVMSVSLSYSIGGTGYADGLAQVYIYDKTNAVLTQIAPYKILNSGIIERFNANFQAATNSTSYRLIFWQSTSVNTYTVKLDDFVVEPVKRVLGSVVTDWVAYTPTFTGFGTVSNILVKSRRVGDTLEVSGYFQSGTNTAVQAQMTLGFAGGNGNVVVDSNKIGAASMLGLASAGTSSTTYFHAAVIAPASSVNYVNFGTQTSAVTVASPQNGTGFVNSVYISFMFQVPIVGWGSTQVLSDQADTRVVAFGTSGQPLSSLTASFTTVRYPTPATGNDSHTSYNSATGEYTILVPGWYQFEAGVLTGGTIATNNAVTLVINKNGSALTTTVSYAGGSVSGIPAIVTAPPTRFVAGDKVTVTAASGATSPTYQANTGNYFGGRLLSGPSQIAANEFIFAEYGSAATTTINSGVQSNVNFDTKIEDTHGIVTLAAGTFNAATGVWSTNNWQIKIPSPGRYEINVYFAVSGNTWNANTRMGFYVFKNGSTGSYPKSIFGPYAQASGGTFVGVVSGVVSDRYVAGDIVDIRMDQNSGSTKSLLGDTAFARMHIKRIGI